MNNTQLFVAVGVPFFTLLLVYIASTISNRSTVNDLRAEMRSGFYGINSRLDRYEAKLDRLAEEVYKLHEGRISKLEERLLSRAV